MRFARGRGERVLQISPKLEAVRRRRRWEYHSGEEPWVEVREAIRSWSLGEERVIAWRMRFLVAVRAGREGERRDEVIRVSREV